MLKKARGKGKKRKKEKSKIKNRSSESVRVVHIIKDFMKLISFKAQNIMNHDKSTKYNLSPPSQYFTVYLF